MDKLIAGSGYTCGLKAKRLLCWGSGLGERPKYDLEYKDIQAGMYHFCALDAGGSIHCWGPPALISTYVPNAINEIK